MEDVTNNRLSFPQRHWFIMCVVVAILSPIVVISLQSFAHKRSYSQATEQAGKGSGSGNSGAIMANDSGKGVENKDTSYKVPVPPQTK